MAATATTFSDGCHAVCKIFLLKSRQSTLISSFLRLPPVQTLFHIKHLYERHRHTITFSRCVFESFILTLRGFKSVFGLAMSRAASNVRSRFVAQSNTLKKLLYEPVIIAESLPFQQHSNLSKIQSFSYSEHNFDLRYSCTCNHAINKYSCLLRVKSINFHLSLRTG